MSKVFSAFDNWSDPCGPGLCPPCRWAYTGEDLRLRPQLITQLPELTPLGLGQTYDLLAAGALDAQIALTCPLRPGRKHLLPGARWGQVTLDDVAVPWRARDAIDLQTVSWLRGAGFGSRMLTEPAPPWSVLRRHPPDSWTQIEIAWQSLRHWRPSSPWLALALHVTLKENH